MTASREIQTSRANRSSLSMTPSSLPARNSYSRTFSSSATLSTANSVNRISRRKSSTITPVNMAALTALRNQAAQGITNESVRLGTSVDRKSPLNPTSDVLEDGPALSSSLPSGKIMKNRARRPSDAPTLKKERTKSNAGDLKCETCGKAYKHGSCLTKHLWEHTPEWQLTSKLLISKHQQVQLLEAASVLVNMNKDIPVVNIDESDNSSASPAASGSSDAIEDDSDDEGSSRNSTPEHVGFAKPAPIPARMGSDSYQSAIAGSYQSTLATSVAASSVPAYGGFSMARQWSTTSRQSDDEHADLTAAARGLQLIGTPQFMPVVPETDVPPVPALPAQYQKQASHDDVDMDMDDDDDDEEEGVFGMES